MTQASPSGNAPTGVTDAVARASLGQKLLRGGAWAAGGRIVTAATGLLLALIVARALPPASAGAFFVAQSLVAFASIVGRLGVDTTAVRLISQAIGRGRPGEARAAVRSAMVVGFLGAASVAGFLAIGGSDLLARRVLHSEYLATAGLPVAAWVFAITLQFVVSEVHRGFHSVRDAVLIGGAITGVLGSGGLAMVAVVVSELTLSHAILSVVAATAISVVIGLSLLTRRVRGLPKQSSAHRVGPGAVLRQSLPIAVSTATAFFTWNVDLWVLSAYRPESEAALYGGSARLALILGTSLIIANQVLPPVIGELYARGDRALLERVLRGVAALTAAPAVAAFIVMALAPRFVLGLIYGSFYESAAPILVVLGIRGITNVLSGSCGFTLAMTGHQAVLMWISGLSGVLAVVSCLVAVGPYGAVGVAWATTLTTIVQQVAMVVAVRRLCGVWTLASPAHLRAGLSIVMRRVRGQGG